MSRAYFALGGARGRVNAARAALKTADVVQDAAQSRRDNGLGTVVSVAQVRRQTAQARFSLIKVSGDERKAYTDLIATIGLDADTRVEIADSSERPLPAQPPEQIEPLLRDALANRPDVIAALGKVEAAQGVLKSRRAAWYPEVAVAAQAYQNIGSLSTDGSPYYNVNKPGGNILLTIKVRPVSLRTPQRSRCPTLRRRHTTRPSTPIVTASERKRMSRANRRHSRVPRRKCRTLTPTPSPLRQHSLSRPAPFGKHRTCRAIVSAVTFERMAGIFAYDRAYRM